MRQPRSRTPAPVLVGFGALATLAVQRIARSQARSTNPHTRARDAPPPRPVPPRAAMQRRVPEPTSPSSTVTPQGYIPAEPTELRDVCRINGSNAGSRVMRALVPDGVPVGIEMFEDS